MCYFWFENLSNLWKLIVCDSQTLRSTQQTQRFPKHPNPVFTLENSADDHQIHTTHNKSVKPVQSALSDLKRPPERLQSQCNYRSLITLQHLNGTLSETKLRPNLPKRNGQW